MRLSPWAWTKVLRPVVAAMRRMGYTVNAYVDDFAATGRGHRPSTQAAATSVRASILKLFHKLGIQVHPTKGVSVGTQRLPLLGFLVDTDRRVLMLPLERVDKVVSMAKCLLTTASAANRWVSRKELTRLTGTAVSCSLALPPARFFLRRLYDCQGGGRTTTRTVRLSHGAMEDLTWFAHLKGNSEVGRALWQPTAGLLTTDASPWGWGGHLNQLVPAAGFFSLADHSQHINVKEVAAIRFCLASFEGLLDGKHGLLKINTDNRVAMHVLNGFSSRSAALMTDLRKLRVQLLRMSVALDVSWIPSVANGWADAFIGTATIRAYGAQWRAFDAYCVGRRGPSLPASTDTVGEYVGHPWVKGTVCAASLKPMLAAIRKRHLAAGYPNPCDDNRVREAKQGFRLAALERGGTLTTKRLPHPSAVAWRLAERAAACTNQQQRHRLTAVVTQFWLMRRAGDVTGLRVCDIELHPDGRTSYRVPRHKTEVTGTGRLIAHTMPPRTDGGVDLPHLLLSRLLADLTTLGVGRSARLFTACNTAAAAGTMTSWLLEGLRLLGVSPPVGRHYSSHS
eukprot:contig_30752_g7522